MQNKIKKPAVLCGKLQEGIRKLENVAAATYGTGRMLQYKNRAGRYASTASFAELLREAAFNDSDMDRTAAVLRDAEIPGQGVKTALILLSALLERGTRIGCAEEDWQHISSILDYGTSFLDRIAAESGGKVPGGGLTLLTLCRPLQKYGRDSQCERAAGVVTYALEQPLLKLAEASGFDGCEVFERVKALAPNQFFSLHHVGIENSIPVDAKYTDYIKVGLDIQKGSVMDLQSAGVMEDVELLKQVLQFVNQSMTAVLNVMCAV